MSDPLILPGLAQLRRRTSAKWRQYPADVLPMWVAEMDVELAQPIASAINNAVEIGDTGYPSGTAYAEALVGFAEERWSWRPSVKDTCLVPDLMSGVAELIRIITEPGDPVVINPPVYPPFFSAARHTGRELVECPLGPDGRLDLDALAETFAELPPARGQAAFLLCSPHNPTGCVHRAEELSRVAQLAAEHDVRVIADEIHAPLVYEGSRFVPYLSLAGTATSFALHSASKAWNLAGIKAALAVGGADTAEQIARLSETTHHPSHLGVIAHTAALSDARAWLEQLLAALERNRVALGDLLAEHLPDVRYRAPEGTFLAWLDCRDLGLGDDPSASFLERGRVALNPGPSFGQGGEGWARINFACSPQLLEEGVRRMAASLRA